MEDLGLEPLALCIAQDCSCRERAEDSGRVLPATDCSELAQLQSSGEVRSTMRSMVMNVSKQKCNSAKLLKQKSLQESTPFSYQMNLLNRKAVTISDQTLSSQIRPAKMTHIITFHMKVVMPIQA